MEDLQSKIVAEEFIVHTTPTGQVLRSCVLTTENGYACSGEPACAVDPANDDMSKGQRIARENALKVLWALEGYQLKTAMQMDNNMYIN